MDEKIYKNISENIKNISNYKKEIKITEEFFSSKQVNLRTLDEVFWNHLLTLFERIDLHEQNNLELDQIEEISDEAKNILDEYVIEMNKIRDFNINDFEKMLLSIYTQRMIQEG